MVNDPPLPPVLSNHPSHTSSPSSHDADDDDDDGFIPLVPVLRMPSLDNHNGSGVESLLALIRQDVEPVGQRLLLPFLTTRDRLRLSECARGLTRYRYCLSRVKIVPHPSPTPCKQRGLVRLLSEQQEEITYLALGHVSVIIVLDLLSWGCFEGLRVLDLSRFPLTDDDMVYLGKVLRGGGLNRLDELNLARKGGGERLSAGAIACVASALGQGACSYLSRLNLSGHHFVREAGQALVAALGSGHCQRLQELDISGTVEEPDSLTALARVLQGGACPDLKSLHMCGWHLYRPSAQALSVALRSMACPNLEVITLPHNLLGWEALLPVMEALEAGAAPHLIGLDLSEAKLTIAGCVALGRVFSSGACPRLRHLRLQNCCREKSGTMQILESLQGKGCPDLRHLDLSRSNLDPDHGLALSNAITSGAYRRLEELILSENGSLLDGIIPVMDSLADGNCPMLQRLDLTSAHMSSDGGAALGHVLVSQGCPELKWLNLCFAFNDRHGSLHVLRAIKSKGCKLRHLDLTLTKLDEEHGRVLGEAIRLGHLAHLEDLVLSRSKSLGVEGMVPLAEALEAGGCPHLKRLMLPRVGLGPVGVVALARALSAGSLPDLREVNLHRNVAIGDQAMAKIIRSLGSGNCHYLTSLCASSTCMGEMAGEALVEALQDRAWPHLEALVVAHDSLADDWVCDLAAAFEGGAGFNLRELALFCSVTERGIRHLRRAYRHGAYPELKTIYVSAMYRKGDRGASSCIKGGIVKLCSSTPTSMKDT